MTTQPAGLTQKPDSAKLEKAAHIVAVFFATFEVLTVHSVLAGTSPMGTLPALALLGGGLFFLLSRIRAKADRRRVLARVAMTASVAAVLGAFVLSGKLAELRGIDPFSRPLLQTLLLLVFQLGWAVTHWLTIAKRQVSEARYIPAAIGTVVLLGGGLLGGGAATAGLAEEAYGVVFKQFATAADFSFAQETARVGSESGSAFAHYHTGGQPLVGLSFNTRDWFGRTRLSDLTGLFEAGADAEGVHRIEARPGYVVASVEVQADDHVNAVRVEFVPFDGAFLLPDGWYWSEWVGSYERGGRVTRLDGGTELVVGVRGASGMVLNSLSLLTAVPRPQSTDG